MKVEPFRKQDFGAIPATDKTDLTKILNAYLQYLKNSKEMSGNSIVSIMIDRTYYNIKEILDALEGRGEDYSKISVTCKPSKKKLRKIDPIMKQKMITEFKNGARYEYEDVPHNVYTKFRMAESQGKYFTTDISKKFKYKKV